MKDDSIQSFAMPHKCGLSCLGPLTFHSQMVGDRIRLSKGGRYAERTGDTFRDALVFSSRSVRIDERICVKVQKQSFKWRGAMRVGFTNLPPSDRALPLPNMAIPNLTSTPGHWAATVNESLCLPGSEVEFWVSDGGILYCKNRNSRKHKLLSGLDLSRPLWAMIDIYGQTCSVFLLGSKKKDWWHTRRSCPAPEALTKPRLSLQPDPSSLFENYDDCLSCINMDIPAGNSCVVCMVREPRITLQCGHQCMCHNCAFKVQEQFGTCPLCRQDISAPLEHSGPV